MGTNADTEPGPRRSPAPLRDSGDRRGLTWVMAALVFAGGIGVYETVSGPDRTGSATVSVGEAHAVGEVLVDGQGYTLYAFEPDEASAVTCTKTCAGTWPPLAVPKGQDPLVDTGVQQLLVGQLADGDGKSVATYAGWPLYRYESDEPGEARGHDVHTNGGRWFAVTTTGEYAPADLLRPAAGDDGWSRSPAHDRSGGRHAHHAARQPSAHAAPLLRAGLRRCHRRGGQRRRTLADATASARSGSGAGDTGHGALRRVHQAGVAIAAQSHLLLTAYDLAPGAGRSELAAVLQAWTEAARNLTAGRSAAADPGLDTGTGHAALTVTVGVGGALLDRLTVPRPSALADLPAFQGDQLAADRSDGDVVVQICADEPMIVANADRVLRRVAAGTLRARWHDTGFQSAASRRDGQTTRNLMGQLDGTNNISTGQATVGEPVWLDAANPAWMLGGTYMAVRRIRMLLDRWEGVPTARQEQVIGRHKASGAPLGSAQETDSVDLDALDHRGASLIPADSHVRLSTPGEGEKMRRRGYFYTAGPLPDGTTDQGLQFISFPKGPDDQLRPGAAATRRPRRPQPVYAHDRQRPVRNPARRPRRPGLDRTATAPVTWRSRRQRGGRRRRHLTETGPVIEETPCQDPVPNWGACGVLGPQEGGRATLSGPID